MTREDPTNGELSKRLDQKVDDFKVFVSQRFLDHEAREDMVALAMREQVDRRFADQDRLLDERFNTQTKALDNAFEAQQTAMAAALRAATTTEERMLGRIKDIEDKQNQGTGRGTGRTEMWGYMLGAATLILAILYLVVHVH